MTQKLGKYTIAQKLGEGAMGAVFKAYDEVLGRYVAIKTMAEDIKWDPELKLRFYREARSAAGLHHPNIVTIHDLGEDGKITYIVMELLEGKVLKDIIKNKDPLPLEKKLSIMAQIAEGLNHAHRNGIIHRDIKPGNIHVAPSGNVKILDFGIARLPSSDLTRSGVRLGTPVYMSPEQIRGGEYDERSDMFSCGIVFYELLTYQHPFRDKNVLKTIDNILFLTSLPFAEQFPDAPAGLWPIVETCLQKEAPKRYPSMDEAGRACRRLLDELNAGSLRLTQELQEAMPRMRERAERPGAPPQMVQLYRDAQRLLSQSDKPDYLTAQRMTDALLREFPRADASARPASGESAPLRAAPPDQAGTAGSRTVGSPPTEQPAPGPPSEQGRGRELLKAGSDLLRAGRAGEALDSLRQALTLLGPQDELVQLIAEARRKIDEARRGVGTQQMDAARQAVAAGRHPEAVRILDEILLAEPQRADAADLRRQALAEIDAAAQRQSRQEEGQRQKSQGVKLMAEKRFRESLAALRRARELLGDDASLNRVLAEAEAQARQEDLNERLKGELAAASQALRAADLDEARRRAAKALELSAGHPEALNLMERIDGALSERKKRDEVNSLVSQSRMAIDRQSIEEASMLARGARELNPEDSSVRNLLEKIAQIKEQTRRQEEVSHLLTKATEAAEKGEFEEAVNCAQEALKVVPDHPRALERLNEFRAAREGKERGAKVAEAITAAKQAFLKGDLDTCEREARAALAFDAKSPVAADLLARVEQARTRIRGEKVESLMAQATAALREHAFQEAEDRAREVLKLDAQDARASQLLEEIARAQEQLRKEELERLLQRSRDAITGHEFAEASRCAERVLELEPKHKQARGLLKEIAKAQRQWEKQQEREKKERERAEAERPGGVSLPSDKTVILHKPPERRMPAWMIWAAAAVILVAAAGGGFWWWSTRTDGRYDPASDLASARASLDQRRLDEAIESARHVLDRVPDNTEAQAILSDAERQKRELAVGNLLIEARLLQSQGKLPEARQVLDKALAVDPANEAALSILREIDTAPTGTEIPQTGPDEDLRKWRVAVTGMINAGKLADAKAEIDKMAQARPREPEVGRLRKLLDLRAAEAARRDKEQLEAAERRKRHADLARRAEDLYRQGNYGEALTLLEQVLAEDAQNAQALPLRQRAAQAGSLLKAFDAAMGERSYDEALANLARLAEINPSDPSLTERRSRADSRKASARATLSVFRLGGAATLLLDDQPIGTGGEVEKLSIPAGTRKLAIRGRSEKSISRQFLDGENAVYVYDIATMELRPFAPGDSELIERRRMRETVFRTQVEHDHFIGKCTGELTITGLKVEYRASEKQHSFDLAFGSLDLAVRNDEFTITTKQGKQLGKFKTRSAKEAKAIQEIWTKLSKIR